MAKIISPSSICFLIALISFHINLSGQNTTGDNLLADARIPVTKNINPPLPGKSAAPADPEKIDVLRHHKRLSGSYCGYAIELAVSKSPLHRDNPLFQRFGNIFYDTIDDGQYSYCILVQFTTGQAVSLYLQNVVKAHAPDAKVVYYKNGKRSNHRK